MTKRIGNRVRPGAFAADIIIARQPLKLVAPRTNRSISEADLDLATGTCQLDNGAIVTVVHARNGFVAHRDGTTVLVLAVTGDGLLTRTSPEIGDVQILVRRDGAESTTGATL